MGIPVGELQRRVTSLEFAEYWAFAQLEPFGPEREDLRAGIVASTVANAYRDRKKHPKPYGPEEFMPRFEAPALDLDDEEEHDRGLEAPDGADGPTADQEDLAARISAMFFAMGGTEGPAS